MTLREIELTAPVVSISSPTVGQQWVLVRLHGEPIGILQLEPREYEGAELADLIALECSDELRRHLVRDALESGCVDGLARDFTSIPRSCARPSTNDLPTLTVAVCTRDRADSLSACLDALQELDYPLDKLDLLVVDNASHGDTTEQCVRTKSPRVRYAREPRPGLDWARNRAVLESRTDIVAYTDDDVIVDRGWARAIASAFEREPDAMAVTGLVVPHETDTEAQILFEQYGGFGRGVRRRYVQVDVEGGESAVAKYCGTGQFGTGANMAFRRRVFESIGLFDPALDVGTVTNGGGDLEMLFRVLAAGHLFIYEPTAIVRHRHRRDIPALRAQLANNGVGYYAYLVRNAHAHPDETGAIVRHGLWWFTYWNLRRWFLSLLRAYSFPRDLIVAELRGSVAGLARYRRAFKDAVRIEREFGPQRALEQHGGPR